MLTARMFDYTNCIAAIKEADKIAGASFWLIIKGMGKAHEFYVEEHGKSAGFLKGLAEDCGFSVDYVTKLNKIRKSESFHECTTENFSFDACIALLYAPEEVREDIITRVEAGEEISTADIKQQVKEAKANLSPEALVELKEDVRKEDNREKELRKKKREAAARADADVYALEDDYAAMEKMDGTCDPALVAVHGDIITDAEYVEVESPVDESKRLKEEQDLNELIAQYDPIAPWAPSKATAIEAVKHIAKVYDLDLVLSPDTKVEG